MSTTLFTGARLVLDGADRLTEPNYVAVEGGRTLMSGPIEAHAHVTGLSLSPRNGEAGVVQIADALE